MRVIKFRGRRIEDGEWLYGDLYHHNEQTLIKPVFTEPYEYPEGYDENVIAETVGQFTGLKDKNGTEIFEGDIIRVTDHPFEGSIRVNGNYTVGYNEFMELVCGSWLLFRMRHYAEIVGNIHQNPELLEVTA